MPKYRVYGVVKATKYVGEYEAETEDDAKDLAWGDAYVSVCHQCSREIEDPEIEELVVEEVEE